MVSCWSVWQGDIIISYSVVFRQASSGSPHQPQSSYVHMPDCVSMNVCMWVCAYLNVTPDKLYLLWQKCVSYPSECDTPRASAYWRGAEASSLSRLLLGASGVVALAQQQNSDAAARLWPQQYHHTLSLAAAPWAESGDQSVHQCSENCFLAACLSLAKWNAVN